MQIKEVYCKKLPVVVSSEGKNVRFSTSAVTTISPGHGGCVLTVVVGLGVVVEGTDPSNGASGWLMLYKNSGIIGTAKEDTNLVQFRQDYIYSL